MKIFLSLVFFYSNLAHANWAGKIWEAASAPLSTQINKLYALRIIQNPGKGLGVKAMRYLQPLDGSIKNKKIWERLLYTSYQRYGLGRRHNKYILTIGPVPVKFTGKVPKVEFWQVCETLGIFVELAIDDLGDFNVKGNQTEHATASMMTYLKRSMNIVYLLEYFETGKCKSALLRAKPNRPVDIENIVDKNFESFLAVKRNLDKLFDHAYPKK